MTEEEISTIFTNDNNDCGMYYSDQVAVQMLLVYLVDHVPRWRHGGDGAERRWLIIIISNRLFNVRPHIL